MSGFPVSSVPGGVEVVIWVVPGSSRPGVDGLHGGAVRVRTAAPPEAGRANAEAAALVAGACGARRGAVVRGAGARRKVVRVGGVDAAAAIAALRESGVPL